MPVDLSREKNYIIAAFVLSLLGATPLVGIIFSITAIVLNYLAFDGYEKKLALSRPKKLYLASIALGILATLVVLGGMVQLSKVSQAHGFPAENPEMLVAYLFLWIIISITVWLNTSAFEELGRYFGIKEFSTYKKLAVALVVGLPLWVVMVVVFIGFFIILGLALGSIIYFLIAVSKLPGSWSDEGIDQTTPVY